MTPLQILSQIALGFVICLVVYHIDTSAFLAILGKLRRANRQLAEKDRTIEGLLEENDNWKAECEQLRASLADAESVNLAGVEHDLSKAADVMRSDYRCRDCGLSDAGGNWCDACGDWACQRCLVAGADGKRCCECCRSSIGVELIHAAGCDMPHCVTCDTGVCFQCADCRRWCALCLGAADSHPDLCDTCAAKADAKRHAVESLRYASPELCGEILGGK